MNGIFDGLITETFGPQGLNILGLNLIWRQGQLFDQIECRPQFFIDGGGTPVS
jgi:hypothetical protein